MSDMRLELLFPASLSGMGKRNVRGCAVRTEHCFLGQVLFPARDNFWMSLNSRRFLADTQSADHTAEGQ